MLTDVPVQHPTSFEEEAHLRTPSIQDDPTDSTAVEDDTLGNAAAAVVGPPGPSLNQADPVATDELTAGPAPSLVAPRACGYGGMLCELAVLTAVREYLDFHGLNETSVALNTSTLCYSGSTPDSAPGARQAAVPSKNGKVMIKAFPETALLGSEFVVGKLLAAFDAGKEDEVFEVWRSIVPAAAVQGQVGSAVELRLHVYFGTFATRAALQHAGAAANTAATLPADAQPNFEHLKAFLASQPSNNMDQSGDNLAALFVLPFVPDPHLRPGLKFIFEDAWVQKLRGDLAAVVTTHAVARHAPALRHLAGNLFLPKATGPPPPVSWHELVRIADRGLAAAAHGLDLQGTATADPKLGRKAEWFETIVRTVSEARACLSALAANPSTPPPAVLAPQGNAQGLRSPSGGIGGDAGSGMQGVGIGLSERIGSGAMIGAEIRARWPGSREVALRAGSASSLGGIKSPQKRLSSARSLESRARTATAPLPVPPALDFGQITTVIKGETEAQGNAVTAVVDGNEKQEPLPPVHAVLWAVLRRLACPDEPLRPRRTFLAAFACFGGPKALALRLPAISAGGDAALSELSLAVLAVCSCEAIGRKEIESAEVQKPGCIETLIAMLDLEPLASPVQMHCLAVLQRLSLRRALQLKMIELGAIDWILQTLQRVGVSANSDDSLDSAVGAVMRQGPCDTLDFSLEFASALLMNLTLRAAGRRRCMKSNGCSILVGLIEHPNPQVRTHINGTLYSLLGVRHIRAAAREQGMEEYFQAAMARVQGIDELLYKQLEYLIMQLKPDVDEIDAAAAAAASGEEQDDPSKKAAADGASANSRAQSSEDSDHSEAEIDGIPEDDGDNFLNEEELAAQFLLSSPVDPSGNPHSPAAALALSMSGEASGAEEVLRRFRASPSVADVQQRCFHGFINSSCSGSLLSPKKGVGRQRGDPLGGGGGGRNGMLPASPPLPALPQSRSVTPGFMQQHLARMPEADEAFESPQAAQQTEEAPHSSRVAESGKQQLLSPQPEAVGAAVLHPQARAAHVEPPKKTSPRPRVGSSTPPQSGAEPPAKPAPKRGGPGRAAAAKAKRAPKGSPAAPAQAAPVSKPPAAPSAAEAAAAVSRAAVVPAGHAAASHAGRSAAQHPPALPSIVGHQANLQPSHSPGRSSAASAAHQQAPMQAASAMADGVVAVGAGQRPRRNKNASSSVPPQQRDQADSAAQRFAAKDQGGNSTSLPQLPRIAQKLAPP
mmetsp:Transcript_8322/g.18624  ORF Transcript_8322/g.18624 Transcript_8322/m.18624 type:complete len:1233 (+) Transcript_8322:154-3852(+)